MVQQLLHKLDLVFETDCSVQLSSLCLVESAGSQKRISGGCLLHLLEALSTISIRVQCRLEHDLGSSFPHFEAGMLLDGVTEVRGSGVREGSSCGSGLRG